VKLTGPRELRNPPWVVIVVLEPNDKVVTQAVEKL